MHLHFGSLEAERAKGSTSCFALTFDADTQWELDALQVALHLVFCVWKLREFVARPGALHLLYVLWLFGGLLLDQLLCTCFPFSDSLGTCCSTSCCLFASHSLTLWELFALPLVTHLFYRVFGL